MITLETLQNYEKYLLDLQKNHINKFFEEQKDYIFCKKGCGSCCKKGEFPISELELMYLMKGYSQLSKELQTQIEKNLEEIKADIETYNLKLYVCPFLIDESCSVYEYRSLICRTHGLSFYVEKDGVSKNKIPACVHDGLNYSQVYDEETKTISEEKWLNSGIKTKPIAHNVHRDVLMNNSTTRKLNLDFGESKKLIDWLK